MRHVLHGKLDSKFEGLVPIKEDLKLGNGLS